MGLNLCDSCRADCRHERNPREIVIKCGAYKPPMTNADRIRAIKDGKMNRVFSCCGHDFTELTCWYMPKYCPNCGAPIADEAVEMVLKRMEEIYK